MRPYAEVTEPSSLSTRSCTCTCIQPDTRHAAVVPAMDSAEHPATLTVEWIKGNFNFKVEIEGVSEGASLADSDEDLTKLTE